MTSTSKLVGDYLIEFGFVTKKQIDDALEAQRKGEYPGKRLCDILIERRLITRAQSDKAIERQMEDRFGSLLNFRLK